MKYIILALISALLLSVSWPTYGVSYFIFIALVPLLLMEHSISKFSKYKRKGLIIFGLSYLTFLIWNIVTTGWLYGAKNPDGNPALLAVVIPVLANSLLYSLMFTLYYWFKKIKGTYWGIAFFIAIWMSFEKFHMSWEFTWPWLNLGNVFADDIKIIQWYDTLGATGGTFWILSVNLFVFYTIRIWEAGRKKSALIKNASILSLLLLIPISISLWKYKNVEIKPTGEINMLLLQPDLDPYNEKYVKDSLQITQELLQLAKKHSAPSVDFFVGPETALPGFGSLSESGLDQHSTIVDSVRNFLKKYPKASFVTGVSSHKNFFDSKEIPKTAVKYKDAEVWRDDFNSAIQISKNQKTQIYHKGKLVPGVEIFPYINLLKPLLGDAMLNFGGSISSLGTDPERKVFTNAFNKAKIAPVICYESIYGEFTTEYIKKGANVLVIMTNDSWWGVSEGHRQLLSYAKLRAIETRRAIARSANSGISAHINIFGEIEGDTLYGDQTALYAKVKLYDYKTNYVKLGDLLSRISIFSLGFMLFYVLANYIQNKFLGRKSTLPKVK